MDVFLIWWKKLNTGKNLWNKIFFLLFSHFSILFIYIFLHHETCQQTEKSLWWCYTAQKWSFPSRTSSLNVTKSAVSLRIWSHLLKKSLKENFIFCAVLAQQPVTTSCNQFDDDYIIFIDPKSSQTSKQKEHTTQCL